MTTENPNQYSQEWGKLIAGYVLGDLTPEEVAEVHQLLTLYPELITELEQLREVLALLPPALPEVYPSRQLRSQILKNAQFNLYSESQPSTQIKEFNLTKYLNKTFFVGGIMAILLVGIGFDSYRTSQQLATLKVN